MNLNHIIIRPLITEKTTTQNVASFYGFEVERHAQKNQIKQAVEKLFGVNVVGVRVSRIKSIKIRTGRKRLPGTTHPSKKAIVTLKAGQTITYEEAKKV